MNPKNENCWCGSGKPFVDCHRDREQSKPLPYSAQYNLSGRMGKHKLCMHPLADTATCSEIINAHTVQRSVTLAQLTDSTNHVRAFDRSSHDDYGFHPVVRVGWRQASTFTGFCGTHDNSTFRPVEDDQFTGTDEQAFLLGYRALCHEIFSKRTRLQSIPHVARVADRGLPLDAQREVQHRLDVMRAGMTKGLHHFEALKREMDQQLLSANFNGWEHVELHFDGDLCVAAAGVVSPNRTLDGDVIQDLAATDPSEQESMMFNIVATGVGGVVAFSWPSRAQAPYAFVSSLLKRSPRDRLQISCQFAFAYLSNVFFSGSWWDQLEPMQWTQVAALATTSNPYYTDFEYHTFAPLVPWEYRQPK